MSFEKHEKENQNKVINAACEVFARHGYRKASMKDIAEQSGVSKSVLFKYFSTKENLYRRVFRLASDGIREADHLARLDAAGDEDLFSLMRRSAKTRLALFKEFPWFYKFSYTAAFDPDPFVKDLVKQELDDYRRSQLAGTANPLEIEGAVNANPAYQGLRKDIPLDVARQVILWVSQGYLEEKLYQNEIDPDGLEQGFARWIDVLELMLKDKNNL